MTSEFDHLRHAVTQNLPVRVQKTTPKNNYAWSSPSRTARCPGFPAVPSVAPHCLMVSSRARPLRCGYQTDAYNLTVQHRSPTLSAEIAYVAYGHGFYQNNPATKQPAFGVGYPTVPQVLHGHSPNSGGRRASTSRQRCHVITMPCRQKLTAIQQWFAVCGALYLVEHLDHDPDYFAIDPHVGWSRRFQPQACVFDQHRLRIASRKGQTLHGRCQPRARPVDWRLPIEHNY